MCRERAKVFGACLLLSSRTMCWSRSFRIPDGHLCKASVDSCKVSSSFLQDVKKEVEQLSPSLRVFTEVDERFIQNVLSRDLREEE
jgi:hypothetical protein